MRIGIDARPLSKRRAGVGNYVLGLVKMLPRLAPQHEYFLYSNKPFNVQLPEGTLHQRFDSKFSWCPGSFWLLGRGGRLARRDGLDVFWATDPILPINVPRNVLKVVNVYDMVWLKYPQTTTRYTLMVQTLTVRKAVARADYVVTISRSTQDDLVASLGVPKEKTKVVYPGVADSFKPADQAASARYISDKYGVPERYMAAVGTVEPRKNLSVLVQALRILKSTASLDSPLLVVGASGWKNSSLFSEIRSAGLTENEIRFLGYIPDADMPKFYAGSQLFLFPSLYEGFGLPPVEAMACGAPVIASNAPCMPEILGDASMLVPYDQPEVIASAIKQLRDNESLRETLRAKGLQRARMFNYDVSAKQLLDIFDAHPLSLKTAALQSKPEELLS
jgi:glycosyltransferase involved in cell wall biosynthesis